MDWPEYNRRIDALAAEIRARALPPAEAAAFVRVSKFPHPEQEDTTIPAAALNQSEYNRCLDHIADKVIALAKTPELAAVTVWNCRCRY